MPAPLPILVAVLAILGFAGMIYGLLVWRSRYILEAGFGCLCLATAIAVMS